MNLYLEPPGFLGTGASLLADLTLLAYLLLIIPGMIVGSLFARWGLHRPHHKWAMTIITIVNWVLILTLMIAAYRFDVAENVTQTPGMPRYLLPTVHALFGVPAQALATFIVVRMFIEDYQVARAKARGERDTRRYWFRGAKWTMRLSLALWLITASFGVASYLVRYNVIPTPAGGGAPAPISTPEVDAPIETPDVIAPIETPEADAPVETPEASGDEDG
jgi:hypothetical protein